MKCNATIAVVGKIIAYETCGIPKILIRIRHWSIHELSDPLLHVFYVHTLWTIDFA